MLCNGFAKDFTLAQAMPMAIMHMLLDLADRERRLASYLVPMLLLALPASLSELDQSFQFPKEALSLGPKCKSPPTVGRNLRPLYVVCCTASCIPTQRWTLQKSTGGRLKSCILQGVGREGQCFSDIRVFWARNREAEKSYGLGPC